MNSWLSPDWDRGYEKGRLTGVVEERERIIKIIDKHFIENDEVGTGYCQGCNWESAYGVSFEDHLVALIKEEQK